MEHPDAGIFASFPGVGPILTAVLLAEIGEDRDRFPEDAVLLAEAGLAPITRASGRSRSVRFRYAANSRLRKATMWWAFNSIKLSPWAAAAFREARDQRGQRYHRHRPRCRIATTPARPPAPPRGDPGTPANPDPHRRGVDSGSLPRPLQRNVLTQVPKQGQEMVASIIRTVFAQPDGEHVTGQLTEVVTMLQRSHPKVASMLEDARDDVTAFRTFPAAHWRQIWSTNPLERVNKEIKRRTDVVGVFPNPAALLRLAGAVLVEQHDEWDAAERRYFSEHSMKQLDATAEEVVIPAITAA